MPTNIKIVSVLSLLKPMNLGLAKDDCVASDIDVVGFHPKRKDYDQIWVVSRKSWQDGFDPKRRMELISLRYRKLLISEPSRAVPG
jgi:hypothetical protein